MDLDHAYDPDELRAEDGAPGQGMLHQRIQIVLDLLSTSKYADITSQQKKIMEKKSSAVAKLGSIGMALKAARRFSGVGLGALLAGAGAGPGAAKDGDGEAAGAGGAGAAGAAAGGGGLMAGLKAAAAKKKAAAAAAPAPAGGVG